MTTSSTAFRARYQPTKVDKHLAILILYTVAWQIGCLALAPTLALVPVVILIPILISIPIPIPNSNPNPIPIPITSLVLALGCTLLGIEPFAQVPAVPCLRASVLLHLKDQRWTPPANLHWLDLLTSFVLCLLTQGRCGRRSAVPLHVLPNGFLRGPSP